MAWHYPVAGKLFCTVRIHNDPGHFGICFCFAAIQPICYLKYILTTEARSSRSNERNCRRRQICSVLRSVLRGLQRISARQMSGMPGESQGNLVQGASLLSEQSVCIMCRLQGVSESHKLPEIQQLDCKTVRADLSLRSRSLRKPDPPAGNRRSCCRNGKEKMPDHKKRIKDEG